MNGISQKIENCKEYLSERLRESNAEYLLNARMIEEYFYNPYNDTSNPYKAAIKLYDILIFNQ